MPTSPVKKMKKATPFLPKLRVFKVDFGGQKKKDEIIMKYRHNGFNLEDLSKSYRTTIESLVENFSSFQFSCL